MVSGSLDTSIRVWDAETGACKHTLMGHQSLTSGMELRNNILVSGNADSTVKVWDIISGKCLQTLSGSFSYSILSIDYTDVSDSTSRKLKSMMINIILPQDVSVRTIHFVKMPIVSFLLA